MLQIQQFSINLESLLDLSAKLNETNNEEFILNSALLSLMGKLRIFRACILKPSEDKEYYKFLLSKGKNNQNFFPYFSVSEFKELDHDIDDEMALILIGYRFCLPVIYNQQLLALILLGNRVDHSSLTEQEVYYSNLVCSIVGNALQNAYSNISLVRAKLNLEKQNLLLITLFEISRDFSSLISRNQIFSILSLRLMGHLMVNKFALFLIDEKKGFYSISNRFDEKATDEINIAIKHLNDEKKYVELLQKTDVIDEFEEMITEHQIIFPDKVKLISPMFVQGNIKGLMLVGKKLNKEHFNEDDVKFIEALGNTAMAAIENDRLFQEEIAKKKLESELKLALEIQTNLLPKSNPVLENFDIFGISIPSRHVGGDYFDFIRLDDEKMLVAIADVSGKGMPASLLMANVQAALRVLSPLRLPLAEMVVKINSIVYQNTSAEKFVTFFYGILDIKNSTFEYLNAGHNPPFLFRNSNEIEVLSEGGLILGFLEEAMPYSVGTVKLENNETIVLYTDGIPEALDPDNQEFGEDKLKNVIIDCKNENAKFIADNIIEAIHNHAYGLPQYDDITLIVIKKMNE